MEKKKEFLTEENYERGKKKLKTIAIVILIVGLLIGGSLIVTGLVKQKQTNSEYSEESKAKKAEQLEAEKQKLTEELDTEKQNLITSKTTLENKIKPVEDEIKKLEREKKDVFMNGGFSDRYYEIEDKVEELEKSIQSDKKSINVINDVLEDADFTCSFDGENNTYTSKYCSLNNQVAEKNDEIENLDFEFSDFKKEFNSFDSIPFYMIGGFIIFASAGIAGIIYFIVKRREIMAFTTQQVMPVAQEGIEKMAPTVGSAMGTIGKELAKGIKEGIDSANDQNSSKPEKK